MAMAKRSIPLTCTIKEGDKDKLEAIASELGYTWGGHPCVSSLVQAIADGDVTVIKPISIADPWRTT